MSLSFLQIYIRLQSFQFNPKSEIQKQSQIRDILHPPSCCLLLAENIAEERSAN